MKVVLLAHSVYANAQGEAHAISTAQMSESTMESLYIRAIGKTVIGSLRDENTDDSRIMYHAVDLGRHCDFQSFMSAIRKVEAEAEHLAPGIKRHWTGFKLLEAPSGE